MRVRIPHGPRRGVDMGTATKVKDLTLQVGLRGWRRVETFEEAEPAGYGYTPLGVLPLALAWTGQQLAIRARVDLPDGLSWVARDKGRRFSDRGMVK